MGAIGWFLFVYILGGFTFVPLVLCVIFLDASRRFPIESQEHPSDDPANIKQADDDELAFRSATDDLAEKFLRRHESDVASGYFAVTRQYVSGGVNGRPPDRLSPAGEVVANESPSVYQSMYRSIFDRSAKPTIEPNKDVNGRATKRARNVFFVVLRLGHLMLYDDHQQLEVRYVISLEHHEVDIYNAGEEFIREPELFAKRHAVRLRRRRNAPGDGRGSLPFFLFSENNSEKEDFYFAILKNQDKITDDTIPEPQQFDVNDIVTLVQKLHSSEEHLQTRWLNAVVGRIFLATYKTSQFEAFVREKLTNKITRVKKPNFLTSLALQRIDLGNGAPFFTNPRLKDLTVNGECMIEADLKYEGNFRIEIAATAKLDLGQRFKAIEVELVLAVIINKIEGHMLARIKPPPSNRVWYTFERMPKLEMTIKPIVSSRQVTYTIILKAIESRIREVVAETLVLPFWDDTPFLMTNDEKYRGGIWKTEPKIQVSTEIHSEDPEDEAEAGEDGTSTPSGPMTTEDERSLSNPALPIPRNSAKANAAERSGGSLSEALANGPFGEKSPRAEPPRIMRPRSFAAAADPKVTASHVDADSGRREPDSHDIATALLNNLSGKSLTASPSESPVGTPPTDSALVAAMKGRSSSNASKESADRSARSAARQSSTASSMLQVPDQEPRAGSPTTGSFSSKEPSINENGQQNKRILNAARSLTAGDRKQAVAQINAAASAAQKWGWGVINRNKPRATMNEGGAEAKPDVPMGRGRPLPPPGVPLPPPERSSTRGSLGGAFAIPKRKPLPPPTLPKRPDHSKDAVDSAEPPHRPPLPERRNRKSLVDVNDNPSEDVMVVEAPTESAPASPAASRSELHDEFFGHGENEVGAHPTQHEMNQNKGGLEDAREEPGPSLPPLHDATEQRKAQGKQSELHSKPEADDFNPWQSSLDSGNLEENPQAHVADELVETKEDVPETDLIDP